MAQLRDRHTSELILEGTPLEVALVAEQLGPAEVLFDDVGAAFDPAAVRQAHHANLEALQAAAAAERDRTARAALETQRSEAVEEERQAVDELAPEAQQKMDEARERVE